MYAVSRLSFLPGAAGVGDYHEEIRAGIYTVLTKHWMSLKRFRT